MGELCNMTKILSLEIYIRRAAFLLAFFPLALVLSSPSSADLGVAALVNGEPISTREVEQRQRFLAITSGFNDEIKSQFQAVIKKPETQEKFKAFVQTREAPRNKEEQVALQREFIGELQKSIQARVIQGRMSSMRQKALDELIDEKLMLQDAKENGVVVTDQEVMQQFVKKTDDGKTVSTADELFAQLKSAGVDPKTFKDKKRAQIAWLTLIRRRYSFRIQNAVAIGEGDEPAASEKMVYDLRAVRLSLPSGADQKQLGRLWSSADNLRQRFSTCEALDGQAKLINASLVKHQKKPLDGFSPDARALISKSAAGQMTPPIILKDAVEIYAVCNKTAAPSVAGAAKADDKGDKRQQEFQIQAKGHLNTLRKKAHIQPTL